MDLKANNGTVSMEITITRKETGKVEKHILTGDILPQKTSVVHECSGALQSQESSVNN